MATCQATTARNKHTYDRLQQFMACACMPSLAKDPPPPVKPPVATATIREMIEAKQAVAA